MGMSSTGLGEVVLSVTVRFCYRILKWFYCRGLYDKKRRGQAKRERQVTSPR